jgi:glucose 1-dehydrogenase
MLLENKVAIVTGAARGIGFAIAQRFLGEGAKVVIADIDDEAGATALADLERYGPVRFVECDIGERLDVRNLITATVEAFGNVDVLVNNAGILAGADFLEIDEADFDRVIRVNVKGTFLCGQAVARHMVECAKEGHEPGVIINLSSINALMAIANHVPYVVSKGAISALTKAMAVALAPYGIRVNAIGPGSIMTDMLATVMHDAEARRQILSRTPLGRLGEPSEVAGVAAFLASQDARYMTGQTVYVDGGRLVLNYTVPVKE